MCFTLNRRSFTRVKIAKPPCENSYCLCESLNYQKVKLQLHKNSSFIFIWLRFNMSRCTQTRQKSTVPVINAVIRHTEALMNVCAAAPGTRPAAFWELVILPVSSGRADTSSYISASPLPPLAPRPTFCETSRVVTKIATRRS